MRQSLGVCAVTGAVIAACHSNSPGSPAEDGSPGAQAAAPPPASSYPAATQPVAHDTLVVTDGQGLASNEADFDVTADAPPQPPTISMSGVEVAVGEWQFSGSVSDANAGQHATLALNLPVHASAAPFDLTVLHDQSISGHFAANGELEPIWALFYGGDQTLGGTFYKN